MSAAPEALIICPLCRDGVATSAFDDHLRRAHDLVTYRDVRAALLPKYDPNTAGDLVDALVAGVARPQALRLLRALEKRSGRHPVVVARHGELQQTATLACPRCGVELRRAAMEQHLWSEH